MTVCGKAMQRLRVAVVSGLVLILVAGCRPGTASLSTASGTAVPQPAQPDMILLTTTSVRDSGLLDVLVADFQRRTGYRVKPIVAGSGQVLTLGANGAGDVLLTHSPSAEMAWLAAGHGLERRLVMFNDYLIVGPPDDPAGLRDSPSTSAALQRVASQRALFISRGDRSGTHTRERQLWQQAGIVPAGNWYQESGTGQGQSLQIASEKRGYVLTDRGTYLVQRQRLALIPLVEHTGPELLNIYHVLTVNPVRGKRVNAAGGRAFADYIVEPAAQTLIASFGTEQYGEPVFTAAAGREVADLP